MNLGRLARKAVPLALAAALAACGGTLAPTDLASLDGAWKGDIGRVRGDQDKCRVWGLELTIRGGAVAGSAFDVAAPAARYSFNSYVETDGGMFIDALAGGEQIRISGRFSRSSFTGTSRSGRGCDGRVSLSRAGR
jgi:hypothetical protein